MKKSLTSAAVLCAAAFSLTSAVAVAQVDVVESTPRMPGSSSASSTSINAPQPAQAAPASPQNVQAEMFYRLQILQQEVQSLRGLVEEQAYELKRLKQQRLDDYVDLDRRISAVTKGGAAVAPEKSNSTQTAESTGSATGNELQHYRAAIRLVLKDKNYAEAITSFNQYLDAYPEGRYAANAQYWLGEIYLLQNDLEQARQWFTRLLQANPEHDKADDAKFKLGTVYHKLGDSQKAKSLLNEVAASDANAARLARDYLSANLP
jgi:tol-pal system protein YbgF